MAIHDQLPGVFDGHQPLVAGNLADQSFGPRGLPGPRGSRDNDVLAAANGQPHESFEVRSSQEVQQLPFGLIEGLRTALGGAKYAAFRQLFDAPNSIRRPAN